MERFSWGTEKLIKQIKNHFVLQNHKSLKYLITYKSSCNHCTINWISFSCNSQ